MEILIVNFSLDGMTESEFRNKCDQVAPAFAALPGLISKVWLSDPTNGVYGGVYTFEDEGALQAYLGSALFEQVGATPGFTEFSVRQFGVLTGPTAVTRGLAGALA